MTIWRDILNFYKGRFKLEETYVNFMADREILFACLSGLSNISIANSFDMNDEDVSVTIESYFGFTGFKEDLDISPIMVYNMLQGIGYKKRDFNREIKKFSKVLSEYDVDIYSCCEKLMKLDKKVEAKWK